MYDYHNVNVHQKHAFHGGCSCGSMQPLEFVLLKKKKEKKVTVTKADAEQTDLPDARMDVMALMFILDQIFISS